MALSIVGVAPDIGQETPSKRFHLYHQDPVIRERQTAIISTIIARQVGCVVATVDTEDIPLRLH